MIEPSEKEIVRDQYRDSSNLGARLALHERFGTSKTDWPRWVFGCLRLSQGERVLELGCGNGNLWLRNADRMPRCRVTLSDFSEGMLDAAKANLGGGFAYEVIDAQSIPHASGSFDAVIANHMLYHVPDRAKAIAEIARVLAPGGRLYAATNGLGHMGELVELVEAFDPRIRYGVRWASQAFGLENGAEQLKPAFASVELLRPEPNTLIVTQAQPLADYVLSSGSMTNVREIITPERVADFIGYIESILAKDGRIVIRTEGGMFLARK